MTEVLIVDYGLCNLDSVVRATECCGGQPRVSADPADLASFGHVILPGVSSFTESMNRLNKMGWSEALKRVAEDKSRAILGICLGMQLLSDQGEEGASTGATSGLGLIPGRVVQLKQTKARERIPHVGWNEVRQTKEIPVFEGIEDGKDFYFANSYHFLPSDTADVAATTPYCGEFVSVLRRENVVGAQFHPEKSQKPGQRFLANFLAWEPSRA